MEWNLDERKELYNKAYHNYGKINQTIKAIEEMSELQKELSKAVQRMFENKTIENISQIVEELADVEIMVEQLQFNFLEGKHDNKIEYVKQFKLNRLKDRLNE